MITPDYLQQSVLTRQKRAGSSHFLRPGFLPIPSLSGVAWASLDLFTILCSALLAVRTFALISARSDAGFELHQHFRDSVSNFGVYVGWFTLCFVVLTRSYGLYGPVHSRSGLNEQRLTVQVTLTAGLLLCGALYVGRGETVPRMVVLLTILFVTAFMCGRRAIYRNIVYSRCREGLETRNVLIVGAGRVGSALRNHLDSLPHMGFRFKGFVALTEQEAESSGADVIGHVRNTLTLARSLFVDEIFLSVPADKKLVISLVEEARAAGIDVRVVPDLYDGLAWNAAVEYIGQFPTIPLHRREFPVGAFLLKRALDITLSLLVALALSPVFLLIALAVSLSSDGPIFYRAQRIGRKGRKFVCYKFRTMVQNADSLKEQLAHMNERDGILFKIARDPRVTQVGRVLRKYSLDELPQLYNVIRGDMSLVGPRPPVAAEVLQYDLSHLRRLDVLPGITGLWQVEARQDPSFDSYISLDTAYVENWSLWLDLKILTRTFAVVFTGTGS